MKKIFSCSNNVELAPYRSVLDHNQIPYLVKNEFAIGAVGEIPINESWPQIWVINSEDENLARELCIKTEQQMLNQQTDWICHFCGEDNAGSFEICWQCEALPTN